MSVEDTLSVVTSGSLPEKSMRALRVFFMPFKVTVFRRTRLPDVLLMVSPRALKRCFRGRSTGVPELCVAAFTGASPV